MMLEGSRMAPIIGLASMMVLGASLVLHTRLAQPLDASEPPPREVAASTAVAVAPSGCDPERYEELVRHDADEFGVAAPSQEVLSAPLRGGVEFSGVRVLNRAPTSIHVKPARRSAHAKRLKATVIQGALETQSLSIRLEVEQLPQGSELVDHLVLSITNRAAVPVAYRVLTEPVGKVSCAGKYSLPHNAIVLQPGEIARRTECLLGDAKPTLRVRRVEAYEVSELGARYLKRLPVVAAPAFDARVVTGHRGEPLPLCPHDFANALARLGSDGFRVLTDFYARHNCEHYRLPVAYRPGAPVPFCDGMRYEGPPPARMDVQPGAPVSATSTPPWPILAGAGLVLILVMLLMRSAQREVAPATHVATILVRSVDGNLHDAYFR